MVPRAPELSVNKKIVVRLFVNHCTNLASKMASEVPEEHEYSSASADESDTNFCVLLEEYSKQPPMKIAQQEIDLRVDLSVAQSESVKTSIAYTTRDVGRIAGEDSRNSVRTRSENVAKPKQKIKSPNKNSDRSVSHSILLIH